jgi:butyryl-CoA dehydrogenase
MQSPAADQLAIQAKLYSSEISARVIIDLLRVVGLDAPVFTATFFSVLMILPFQVSL